MAIFDAVCDIPIFTGIGALWMAESISTCNSSLHFKLLGLPYHTKTEQQTHNLKHLFYLFFKKSALFWEKMLFWLEQNAYSNIFVGASGPIRISLFS